MSRPQAFARQLPLAFLFLLLPATASAHLQLRRSEPAADSALGVSPARIALWFTARPQLPFSRIRLLGPSGEIPLGELASDTANGFSAAVVRPLAPGEYTVEWQTASADGHPIRGRFRFVVLSAARLRDTAVTASPPPGVTRPSGEQTTGQEAPAPMSEYKTARWIEFVALLTVLGVLGFRHGVLPALAVRGVPTSDAADRARRLGQSAVFLYAVAAVTRLYTQSAALFGAGGALDAENVVPMLTDTTWGWGWLIGAGGAIVLAIGWPISRKSVTIGTPLALTGALALLAAPALTGHAATGEYVIFSVTFDMLHVAAAGVWLGGLFIVFFAGLPAMRVLPEDQRHGAVALLVNSFHPIALLCVPLVVLAGVASSWMRLGYLSALWETPYGRTLLLKVGIFVVLASVGAYNALRLRRRLGVAQSTRHLRLSAGLELLLASTLLAITATLVATPIPVEPTP